MGLLVSLALVWPSAGADGTAHHYEGSTDCGQFKTCPLALFVCTRGPAPGILIVCIDGGHIQPDAITGEALVTITDNTLDDVGAYVCQDNDEDGDCGSVSGGELGVTFCGSQWIKDIAHDGLWDPAITLYVLPGGELTTVAACTTSGAATQGFIFHS